MMVDDSGIARKRKAVGDSPAVSLYLVNYIREGKRFCNGAAVSIDAVSSISQGKSVCGDCPAAVCGAGCGVGKGQVVNAQYPAFTIGMTYAFPEYDEVGYWPMVVRAGRPPRNPPERISRASSDRH